MKGKKKVKDRRLCMAEIDIDIMDRVRKVCKEKGFKIYAYISNAVNNQLSNDQEEVENGN